MKFKGNRKHCREETEKMKPIFLGKLPAGKLFCECHITTKRREIESRIVECLYSDKHFCPKLKSTRGYQKVLSLRHFPHSDSTMLHT